MSETDSDGIPELVSSEDESFDSTKKSNYDIAANWLSTSHRFLEKQDRDIRIFCFGPFLFNITDVLSSPWIEALKATGLILNDECYGYRGEQLVGYDWREWALLDLMDAALEEVQRFLRDKENSVKLLDLLDRIEFGNVININLGIKLTNNLSQLERNFFRKPICEGKEIQARFAVLYIGRIYKKHMVGLCKESKDMAVEKKKSLRSSFSIGIAEQNKVIADEEFQHRVYGKAVDYYSRAAIVDCLNPIYFENRAHAFYMLRRHRDGLADGRRCIVLKPGWSKGHYRYAQAFYELNKLDLALEANRKGQKLCKKSKDRFNNLGDLVEQGIRFEKDKKMGNSQEVTDKIKEKSGEIEEHCSSNDPDMVSSSDSEADSQTKQEVPSFEKMTFTDAITPTTMKPPSLTARPVPSTKTLPYKEKVQHYMMEGSNLLCEGIGKSALYSYQKALNLIAHSNYEAIGIDEKDHVVLKYACGMAAIATGLHKHILNSMDTFVDITKSHIGIKFPLAYFGMGKAYIALNRYVEAQEPIGKGIRLANHVKLVQLQWPGTSLNIEESTYTMLMNTLKSMNMLTKYPPPSDALCCIHSDDDDKRKSIYFTDPNFEGFVQIICDDHCKIEFHHHCWKAYKCTYGKKTCDKDILDSVCPTPNCTAVILKIDIFGQNSLQNEMIVSDKPRGKITKQRKPRMKMKLSSAYKIARREERKQIRKQIRRGEDDLMDDVDEVMDNINDDDVKAEEIVPRDAFANHPNIFILKKEEDDPAEKYMKPPKTKKKREKLKQILNLDVNFTDQKEKYLLNESSFDDENEQAWASTGSVELNPCTVLPTLQEGVTWFESSNHSRHFISADDNITENLLLFFEGLLEATGPINIEGPRIMRQLEACPQEAKDTIENAGGLACFLSQSSKFVMVENIVCLLKGASMANQFAKFSTEGHAYNILEEIDTVDSKNGELARLPSLNPNALEFHPNDDCCQVVTNGKHLYLDKDLNFPQIPKETVPHLTRFMSDNISYPIDSSTHNKKKFCRKSSEISDYSVSNDIRYSVGDVTEEFGHVSLNQCSFLPEFKMDTLDSIDDVPQATVRKTKKSSKQLCKYQSSETDSESVQEGSTLSDEESLCSQDDNQTWITVGKKKNVVKPAIADPVNSSSNSRLNVNVSDQSKLSGIWSSQLKSSSLTKRSFREPLNRDCGFSDQEQEKFSSSLSENLTGISRMDEFSSNASCLTTSSTIFSGNSQLISSFQSSASPRYSSPTLGSQTRFTKFDPCKGAPNVMNNIINPSWNDYATPFDTGNLGNGDNLNDTSTIQDNEKVVLSDISLSKNRSAEEFMRQHYKSDKPKPVDFPLPSTWYSSDDALIDELTPPSSEPDFTPFPPPSPLPVAPFNLLHTRSHTSLHSDFLQPISTTNINAQVKTTNQINQSVQCSLEMSTVSVNTDRYEPLREEYCILEKECNILILNLETATAKAHEMMETSNALDVKNKSLKEDLHRLLAEKSKWEEDKSVLFGEIQQMRQLLANKEAMEKTFQSACDEIKKEHNQSLNAREKILEEKQQLLDSVEKYRRKFEIEADRAKKAEIEILKTRQQQNKQNLEHYQHISHLTEFAKTHQEGQAAVPPQIQQALDYYNMVNQKCEEQFSSLSMKSLVSTPMTISPFLFGPGSKTFEPTSSPVTIMPQPNPTWSNNNGSIDASDKHYQSTTTDTPQQQIPQKPRPPPMFGTKLRPLLTRPPVLSSLGNRPPLRPTFPAAEKTTPPVWTNGPKSSFEKLIMLLQITFPNRDRIYFQKSIMDLRQRFGGSLSGMTLDDIMEQIKKSIEQQQNSSNQGNTDVGAAVTRPLGPPPGLSSSWVFPKQMTSNTNAEVFQEEDNPCVICYDEMCDQDTAMLVCGHNFHRECIRKWLKEQSTCPNCRIHALLSDDFPVLK